ncbi:unnamed protein product, partial [Ixodes pacificus]
ATCDQTFWKAKIGPLLLHSETSQSRITDGALGRSCMWGNCDCAADNKNHLTDPSAPLRRCEGIFDAASASKTGPKCPPLHDPILVLHTTPTGAPPRTDECPGLRHHSLQ